ncbi:uncharacterized protein LOC107771919 isoform X2 [Nicotiana tabacum]|uniref:Uncharacterized protein LOC107771919 isoform X2 n=1 Tax=Nicotiana tabacum TaxID=4097 RepID=A0AC58TC99_TOBAC
MCEREVITSSNTSTIRMHQLKREKNNFMVELADLVKCSFPELLEGLKVYRKYDGNILLLLPEENAMHLKMSVERTCMPSPSAEQFVEAVKATVLSQERWPVSRCVCCYTYATDSVNDNGRTGYFAKTIWRNQQLILSLLNFL